MNLNKVFVLGNLTRDPDRKNLPSGNSVVSFGIATNRFFTNQNQEKQQETEFHNITAFGRLAEISSQYLKKGSLVLIEGRLRTNSWQDSSGVKHFKTEIITERMQLGPKGVEPKTENKFSPETKTVKISDEDIPVIEEDSKKNPKLPQKEKDSSQNKEEDIDVSQIPF